MQPPRAHACAPCTALHQPCGRPSRLRGHRTWRGPPASSRCLRAGPSCAGWPSGVPASGPGWKRTRRVPREAPGGRRKAGGIRPLRVGRGARARAPGRALQHTWARLATAGGAQAGRGHSQCGGARARAGRQLGHAPPRPASSPPSRSPPGCIGKQGRHPRNARVGWIGLLTTRQARQARGVSAARSSQQAATHPAQPKKGQHTVCPAPAAPAGGAAAAPRAPRQPPPAARHTTIHSARHAGPPALLLLPPGPACCCCSTPASLPLLRCGRRMLPPCTTSTPRLPAALVPASAAARLPAAQLAWRGQQQ